LRTDIYFFTQFTADFTLYMILNMPSFIMVCIGYRHMESKQYVSQGWLVAVDVITKLTFGAVMLPIVYLIGFLQRKNAENIYKSLGLILYLLGHLMNMIILSIIEFNAKRSPLKDDRICSWGSSWYL
jgi:Na+-transporting NADH:ubiquinone oxidoreductase subunit NqrE